ncbi:MAG: DUF4388 domain-containing protein [Acidimicrobiales bacterium]
MLEPSAERTGGTVPDGGAAPDLYRSSVLEMTVDGKESIMSPTGAPDEISTSLTGSLAAFALSDVLMLLASTSQTGELHAVGDDVEGWLWLAEGQLANARVGSANTIGQAVFELACISDGEFSFSTGVVSSSGHPTVPVAAVLQEVRPQVDEWRELRTVVPLDAEVNLAPSPPGQDVRIRNDQWSVLTTVGNSGLSVKSVLERIGGEQIAGLRTLRELQSAGLIAVGTLDRPDWHQPGPAPGEPSHPETGSTDQAAAAGDASAQDAAPPPEPQPGQSAGLAEVAMMPPPIAVDPWAPPPETEDAGGNGVA